jgi:hypothetical protein
MIVADPENNQHPLTFRRKLQAVRCDHAAAVGAVAGELYADALVGDPSTTRSRWVALSSINRMPNSLTCNATPSSSATTIPWLTPGRIFDCNIIFGGVVSKGDLEPGPGLRNTWIEVKRGAKHTQA